MKTGTAIIISGLAMIIVGLILFYAIQNDSNLNESFRVVKHGGTFTGLMGIGVVMAGILLNLMSREEAPIQEDHRG